MNQQSLATKALPRDFCSYFPEQPPSDIIKDWCFVTDVLVQIIIRLPDLSLAFIISTMTDDR